MTGQGCSSSGIRFDLAKAIVIFVFAIAPFLNTGFSCGQTTSPVQLVSSVSLDAPLSEDPLRMRLRLTWGGGVGQTWRGTVKINGGTLSEIAPLALTPDSPTAVKLSHGELVIRHWTASNYGGADVTVEGASDTRIQLTISSTENPEVRFEKEMILKDLTSERVSGEIDSLGNQVSVGRVPGDRLGVEFAREHLVFRPGETFEFSLQPNLTGLSTRSATGRVELLAGNSTSYGVTPLFHQVKKLAFQLDDRGSAEPAPVSIVVPHEEGVYNIELELEPVWYQSSFKSRKNNIHRRIQILVLNEEPIRQLGDREWRQVSITDLTQPAPGGFAAWSRFAGRSKESLGNDLRSPIEVDGQSMMQIAPGGWQALPLEMSGLNKPHRIEIEYVSDGPLAVGMSLLELDAKGQVGLYGSDSGLLLPKSLVGAGDSGKIERHRMTIWPKTKTPYLLIANRHPDHPVTIGKIRVFAGPERLDSDARVGGLDQSERSTRKRMAFYESPIFVDNFGSGEKVETLAESLDDWTTFYRGADRLVQYLKANSYQGAFLTVASDGSSIYPSELLSPSPKHDNGTFFKLGQDPIRKDVLEMLFRMFEREGLLLVPAVALTSPLPEVEAVRNQQGQASFELVDLNQNRHEAAFGGVLPIYNPLDRKVQHAVKRMVGELANRYQAHASFTGIAIICRPDTYTLLPGQQWGNDAATIQQFFQTQTDLDPIPNQWDDVQRVLLGSHRDRWVHWRAARMSAWYHDLASTVREALPQGTLYLAPVDLYRNEEISSALSPSLHASSDFEQSMLQIGFSRELMADAADADGHSALVLLKPHRIASDQPLAAQRVDRGVENSKQAQQFFANSKYAGDLFTHRMSWAHFAQLQSQGPFQSQTTPLMRLQQMTPAGQFNRQRFVRSIKDRDARILVDGGAMMVTGQEDAVEEMMSVYGQLPDIAFEDVVGSRYSDLASLPLAIRQYSTEKETYFYCVNASPWPIEVKFQVARSNTAESPALESLSQARFDLNTDDSRSTQPGQEQPPYSEWVVQVPPFGLVGGRSAEPGFRIHDFVFELPANAEKGLRKRVYALQSKLNKSKNATALGVIENSSFELAGQPALSDWDIGESTTGDIQLTTEVRSPGATAHLGAVSMVMTNDGNRPVWVRSNSFDAPETGRLSISVWLKTSDPLKQPPLRLAIEGESNGSNYYRFGSVGSLSPDPETNQLETHWKRFAVHFDDLPVTGLTNVRIGFDLMGPGEVFVDGVQVFDRWFDENDAKAITQLLASTGPLLSRPETMDSCRRLLEGYWACFLDEYFQTEDEARKLPEERVLDQVTPLPVGLEKGPASDDRTKADASGKAKRKSPMFRRFRNLVPQHRG